MTSQITTDDRLDIIQVLNLYAQVVDARAWDHLGRVFTDDAVYDMTAVRLHRSEGTAAIRKTMETMRQPEAHFALGPVLAPASPDEVRVRSKFLVRLENRTVADGTYDDVVVRTAAGWRIQQRTVIDNSVPLP